MGDIIKVTSKSQNGIADILSVLNNDDYLYCIVYGSNFFFNDTILNNVTLYDDNCNSNINHIMFLANLMNENLRNWDFHSDYKIGVNGELLSVGQKQRLAIARSLTCKSKVILFDDIFNNLDYDNQDIILKRLIRDRYTIFYITDNAILDNYSNTKLINL